MSFLLKGPTKWLSSPKCRPLSFSRSISGLSAEMHRRPRTRQIAELGIWATRFFRGSHRVTPLFPNTLNIFPRWSLVRPWGPWRRLELWPLPCQVLLGVRYPKMGTPGNQRLHLGKPQHCLGPNCRVARILSILRMSPPNLRINLLVFIYDPLFS